MSVPSSNPVNVPFSPVFDLTQNADITDIHTLIEQITKFPRCEDAGFFITDLDEVYLKHLNWKEKMPRVEPYYAVKSNDDIMLLALFDFLGLGFECASAKEIETVMQLGVKGPRFIYGNPIKQKSSIEYAASHGVPLLVFDNEEELDKIHALHPNAQVYIRINVAALRRKFGAEGPEAKRLISKAITSGMNVVGASYYVGFRQVSAANYTESIINARELFDYAREEHGYEMNFLDIGGGFQGTYQSEDLFDEIAKDINDALDKYFPEDLCKNKPMRIVGEPGSYYSTKSTTLCSSIISKNRKPLKPKGYEKRYLTGSSSVLETAPASNVTFDDQTRILYAINDSTYLSFHWYDADNCLPTLIRSPASLAAGAHTRNGPYHLTCVAGATVDSGDFIFHDIFMPEMSVGDFLVFRNMGSYTRTCAVEFNGIAKPVFYYVSSKLWHIYKDAYKPKPIAADTAIKCSEVPLEAMMSLLKLQK